MRFFIAIFLALGLATAAAANKLDQLLARDAAPNGVVIEIVEGDENALKWALPEVSRISQTLRAKFPNLPIAVVTHGAEQFGLVKNKQGWAAGKIRAQAKKLTEAGTPVHVCGGHASARGVSAADFPDFVDVAPSGPAQITAYINQGYELIILRKR